MRRGLGRAGRPSIVGTAARTAVIAGTATAVSGRVAAGQQAKAQQAAAQQSAAQQTVAQQVPGAVSEDAIEQVKRFAELRDAGILTDEEFGAKKAQLLGF
jgi:hypothetical protein